MGFDMFLHRERTLRLPLRKNIHFGIFGYTSNPLLVQMVTFAAKSFGLFVLWELQKK